MGTIPCQSCGTPFKGKYCYQCGEKQATPDDLSLNRFITNSIDAFTHFDGKFFLTMRYLLFSPGKLTLEYLAGRRVKLMKVAQLYLVVAILFFLLFKNWDIFLSRLQSIILVSPKDGHFYLDSELSTFERWLKEIVVHKAQHYHKTFSEMVYTIDATQPEKSKAFAFLMIPWLATSLYLVSFKRQPRFVSHLVHATHLFSFMLIITVMWIGGYELLTMLLHMNMNYNIAFGPVNLLFAIYLFISMRKVLRPKNWLVLIGQFIFVATFGYIGMILVYRIFIAVTASLLA